MVQPRRKVCARKTYPDLVTFYAPLDFSWATRRAMARVRPTVLVLVELDFPRRKPQTAEVKKANEALSVKYKVDGFPTFVVLSKEGKELGRQDGYKDGGAKAFTRNCAYEKFTERGCNVKIGRVFHCRSPGAELVCSRAAAIDAKKIAAPCLTVNRPLAFD